MGPPSNQKYSIHVRGCPPWGTEGSGWKTSALLWPEISSVYTKLVLSKCKELAHLRFISCSECFRSESCRACFLLMCVKASRTSTSLVEGVALLAPEQLGSICCCRSGYGAPTTGTARPSVCRASLNWSWTIIGIVYLNEIHVGPKASSCREARAPALPTDACTCLSLCVPFIQGLHLVLALGPRKLQRRGNKG